MAPCSHPAKRFWSAEIIADFYDRFVPHAGETAKKFNIKLKRQLTRAPAATIQLVAELVYFHLLFSSVTKGPTKEIARRGNPLLVTEARDRTSGDERGVRIRDRRNRDPPSIRRDTGKLAFLVGFAKRWKSLDPETTESLLGDPWKFKELVESESIRNSSPSTGCPTSPRFPR